MKPALIDSFVYYLQIVRRTHKHTRSSPPLTHTYTSFSLCLCYRFVSFIQIVIHCVAFVHSSNCQFYKNRFVLSPVDFTTRIALLWLWSTAVRSGFQMSSIFPTVSFSSLGLMSIADNNNKARTSAINVELARTRSA